jgi:hypothetical protein
MIDIPMQEPTNKDLRPRRYSSASSEIEVNGLTSTKNMAGRVMIAFTSVIPIPSNPAAFGNRGRSTGVE